MHDPLILNENYYLWLLGILIGIIGFFMMRTLNNTEKLLSKFGEMQRDHAEQLRVLQSKDERFETWIQTLRKRDHYMLNKITAIMLNLETKGVVHFNADPKDLAFPDSKDV